MDVENRFRVTAWQRYEPHVETAVNNYPSAIILDPTPFTVNTFSNRLRDAMKAFLKYDYPTYIQNDNLKDIVSKLVVSIKDNTIVLGPREALRKTVKQTQVGTLVHAEVMQNEDVVDNPGVKVLEAFALLLSYQYIEQVNLANIKMADVEHLSQSYDIEIIENDNGTITIL
jgi:hypothetical protein